MEILIFIFGAMSGILTCLSVIGVLLKENEELMHENINLWTERFDKSNY